jgi:hypothetical protein
VRVLPKRRILVVAVLGVYACNACFAASPHHNQPAPKPEERIEVEPVGYRPPGALYMLSERAFTSLDFIDAHHLLFTFHLPRLMQREAHPDRRDNDQVIKAVVLGLPGGNTVTSTEWRMHDRARYLWSLGDGRFLVRERNSFYMTDASLKLHPYLEIPTSILTTDVSPDGHTLVVEHEYEKHSPDQHTRLTQQAEQFGDSPPPEDTQVTLINVASREVLAALRTDLPVHIPVTANGYVSVAKDKTGKVTDQYVVRFLPFQGDPAVLGRVASTCIPHEYFLNQKALMIESCGPRSADVYLDAWTTEGKKLWNGQREGRLVWPNFAFAPNGGRFAESLLSVSHDVDLLDSITDEDVRGQVVQVYDSGSGALLLAVGASPVLAAGQNFALSADGERLAVLHDGAIEIYEVPAPPKPTPGP